MSLTERREIDRMLEEGKTVTQGVIPDLEPDAAYFAKLWSDLRASTPGDQPISIPSMVELVGRDEMRRVLPVIQGMDRTLFETQRERREAERKEQERKAKGRRTGRRR